MWIFSHKNSFNSLQEGFDERKLKTLYIKNSKSEYDSVLMGSSRITYYSQKEFNKMKVFNYSFSAGKPYEYEDFIRFIKTKYEINNLIIGFDFFDCKTDKDENKKDKLKQNKKILYDISNLNEINFFIKNYLTTDILSKSIENIKRSLTNKTGHRSYDRENIAHVDYIDSNEVINLATTRSKKYYSNTLEYDQDFLNTLYLIKNDNKKINILVFTTPPSNPFLATILNDKNMKKYYYQWIKDLVNVFGKVYFTTFNNRLSKEYSIYSKDGDHYYPFVGKEITQYLSGGVQSKKMIEISNNILLIDKNNLDNSLKIIQNFNKPLINNTK
jgi:hypothetical protein